MAPSGAAARRPRHSPAVLSLLLLPAAGGAAPAELRLGYLYLQSPSSWVQESFSQFKLAVREVNADPGLLPNHTLTYALADTEGSEMRALDGAVQLLSGARPAHAIVGTGYSSALVAPAVYCSTRGVPIVSPGSTSVAYADKARYPYLLRSVSNDAGILRCAAVLVHAMGWRKAASLVKTSREQGAIQVLHPALKALGVEYLALTYGDISTSHGERDLLSSLSLIPRAGFRVIVYYGVTVDMARLDELTTSVGLRAQDYSWVMFTEAFVGAWRTGKQVFAVTPSKASSANPVRAAFMARWPNVTTLYNQSIHGAWDPVTKLPFFGASASSEVIWDTDYAPVGDGQPDIWGMLVYDTVWVLAKAFHALLLAGGDPSDGASLKQRVLAVRHMGVTGELLFHQGSQDRSEQHEVVMANGEEPVVLVGRTTPQFGMGAPGTGSWCLAGDCLSSTEAQIAALPWQGGRRATDGRALDAARSDGTVPGTLTEGAGVSVEFTVRDSFGRPPCLDTCNAVGNATALCLVCRQDLAAYERLHLKAYTLTGVPVAPVQPQVLRVDVLTGRGVIELPLGFTGAGLEDRQLYLRLWHLQRTVPMSTRPDGSRLVRLRSLACPLGMSGPPGQCAQCIPGRMAPRRGMGNCTECGLGAAQDLVGQASCKSCSPGRFADARGMSECRACLVGTYLNATGDSACTPCPPPMTTLLLGSQSLVSCACPVGTYRPLGAPLAEGQASGPCQACPTGMECPAGSDARNFPGRPRGASAPVAPRVLPGHWSSNADPLSVYRCRGGAGQCPGGAPESCGQHMLGIACAACEPGYYPQGDVCWDCPSQFGRRMLFPTLPIIVSLGIIVPVYWCSTGPQDDPSWNMGERSIPSLLALALYQLQVAGILVTCNLDMMPRSSGTAWPWVNDALGLLQLQCNGMTSVDEGMTVKLLLPAWCCFCFVFVGLLSRALARLVGRAQLDLDLLWGCLGSCFLAFYVSTCAISFSLFKCYDHPNGEMSVQSAPEVLCFSLAWDQMVAKAMAAVAIYCGGSLALFTWVLWRAPAHRGEDAFNKRWRFLIAKFRLRCRWWTVPWLAKGLALTLAQVVTSRGQDQLLLLLVIIVSYSVATNHCKPWRHADTNFTDVMLHLVLVVICAMLFCYAPTDGGDSGRARVVDLLVAMPLAVILWFLASRLYRMVLYYARKEDSDVGLVGHALDSVLPGAGPTSKAELAVQTSFRAFADLDPVRASDLLEHMAEADWHMLLSASHTLEDAHIIRNRVSAIRSYKMSEASESERGKAARNTSSSEDDECFSL